jgi:PAS domain S-box-containing protein
LRDVTDQKRAEAALRESEEKLRLVFENAFDGIAIYEEYPDMGARRIVECNERYAQVSGRSRKALLEIGDTALIQKPLAPVSYAKPRQALEAAQSEGFFSWVRPDGRENIIEYSATSIKVEGRLMTIGVDRDVTERKQAEAYTLEQQWTQAALQEREQLAQELHDSLSQSLGFPQPAGAGCATLSSERPGRGGYRQPGAPGQRLP